MNFFLYALVTSSIWFHTHKQYTYGFHKSPVDLSDEFLICSVNKKKAAAIVHFFFRLRDTTSGRVLVTSNSLFFVVTSNSKCFARWLSNPCAHCLAFISFIQISRGPCCFCLPMSIFLNIIFLIFLQRQLFLVTVNFLMLLFLSCFFCRCSGSRIVRDSSLCLVLSYGSDCCCFTVLKCSSFFSRCDWKWPTLELVPWALLTSKDVCLLLLLEDTTLAVTTIILKTNIIVKLTGRRMLGFNSFRHTFYVVGSCQWWRMVDFKFISLDRSRAHVRPDLSIWLLGDHFSLNGNYPDLAPYSTWRDVDFEIRAESRLQIPHFVIHS